MTTNEMKERVLKCMRGFYEGAYFTPDGARFATLVDSKVSTRRTIAAVGCAIIANIGNQMSRPRRPLWRTNLQAA